MKEFIESITGFLGLGNEEELMLSLLLTTILELSCKNLSNLLDISIEDHNISKVYHIETDNFFMLDVVPSHFVE